MYFLLKLGLLESVCVGILVSQLYFTLCSSVHGILQARILEWVVMSSSRDLPNPGIEPRSPTLQPDSLMSEPPGMMCVFFLLTNFFFLKRMMWL